MQNDVYHRPHTISKKIYSVYYSCESRISFLFLNIKWIYFPIILDVIVFSAVSKHLVFSRYHLNCCNECQRLKYVRAAHVLMWYTPDKIARNAAYVLWNLLCILNMCVLLLGLMLLYFHIYQFVFVVHDILI